MPSLWVTVDGEDCPPLGTLGRKGEPVGVVDVKKDGPTLSASVGGESYASDCPEWPAPGIYRLRRLHKRKLAKRISRAPSVVVTRTVVEAPSAAAAAPVVVSSPPPGWWTVTHGEVLPGAETDIQDPPGVNPVGPWSDKFTREDEILKIGRYGHETLAAPWVHEYLAEVNVFMKAAYAARNKKK
jgi:hypothetical protein